ncbi:hypothetical protein [Chryseobacterium sp. RLHN22]|uniref:hypothetical protein n=1 Tax=Chryseobacterium sp. RLHN22 TaxID=3437885 RepID=UPI003D9B62A8
MEHQFNLYLVHYILQSKKNKRVAGTNLKAPGNLKTNLPELSQLDAVHKGIEDFYKNESDGYSFEWWSDKDNGIGGKLEFASSKYLFADAGLYDGEGDEELKYFHPLDYPTPESFVGFIIMPDDTIYESLYYMSVSDYELNNLDLDYEGYTQMALEARIFNHWQRVLLYYMDGEGIGSVETETFKTEMPKIFPDWTWENFIAKFESLRLSNKNK